MACCHSVLHRYLGCLQRKNHQFHLKTFIRLHSIFTHDLKTIGVPPHWVTNIFDFIKTNHQFRLKTLRKLHNIYIKRGTLFGVLSFSIRSIFRLFAKGKTFVYVLPCLQKFDNSRTSSIYFSGIDKNTIRYIRRKVHGAW